MEGINAFKWVENIKFLRKDNISKKEIGPNGYYSLEMNGFSDKYSNMSNDNAQDQFYHSLDKKNIKWYIYNSREKKLNNEEYLKELVDKKYSYSQEKRY